MCPAATKGRSVQNKERAKKAPLFSAIACYGRAFRLLFTETGINMCGIIGYSGKASAVEKVLTGLHALEYRGYDSAGLSFFREDGAMETVKAKGKIAEVEKKILPRLPLPVKTAIGHTRWATHGAPSDENSHPHGTERLSLVHNGIIENYAVLKEELVKSGYRFHSATDTEVAACLLDACYQRTGDPVKALRAAAERIVGSYAFAVLFRDRPDEIYGMRKESPLLVGVAEDAVFLASDMTAFIRDTNRYYRMEPGEIAVICKQKVTFLGENDLPFEKTVLIADWDTESAEKGGYATFMEKEIREGPAVIRKTLSPHVRDGLPFFSAEGLDEERLRRAKRITVVACGTAYHAGYFFRYTAEKYARIPTAVEIASEFRYANPILDENDVVVIIAQSGETADSLAALRLAKARGAYTVCVVNVVGSSIAEEADTVLLTLAGPEIAVASTKAYTVQVSLLSLLALHLARLRGTLSDAEISAKSQALLMELPLKIAEILDSTAAVQAVAKTLVSADNLFFLGRNIDYVSALEGSLKLKEISYIHSEAYAAGELKHGTISVIEEGMPVIAVATEEALYEKLISNVKEVLARGAAVYTLSPKKDEALFAPLGKYTLSLPDADPFILPILSATVLQLLALYTATLRGNDVDKPRNLAKSVTVE